VNSKSPQDRGDKSRIASLDGFEEFARQTDTIIEKILIIARTVRGCGRRDY
jgi:hypothetical protein